MRSVYDKQVQFISPLPPGYTDATGQIARSYGGALAGIGESIGNAIKQYAQNEEERGILSSQVMGSIQDETLLKYLKPDRVDSISKKIEAGTVTNKDLKAFLPEIMIAKERYNRDVQKDQIETARKTAELQQSLAQLQINAARQDATNERAFTEAYMGTPKTRQETVQTPVSGLMDASRYINGENMAPPALQALQGASPFSTNVSIKPPAKPIVLPQDNAVRPDVDIARFASVAGGTTRAAQLPTPQAKPIVEPAPAAIQQRDLSAPPAFNATMPKVGQTSQAQQTVMAEIPANEKYTQFVANYIAGGGKLNPKFLEQAKDAFGVEPSISMKPIKDENGKPVAFAVMADGKVAHIVNPPKVEGLTPNEALQWQNKVRELTVNFGGQQFLAPSLQEAKEFRDAVGNAADVVEDVKQLIALTDTPGVRTPGTEANKLANGIATRLQGKLRVAITGPGAVNESEYAMLREIISNPTKLFSIDSNTKASLQSLGAFTQRNLLNKARTLGFEDAGSAKLTTVEVSQPGSVVQYNTKGQRIK